MTFHRISDLPSVASKPPARNASDDEAEGRLVRLLAYVLEGVRSRGAWQLTVTDEGADALVVADVMRRGHNAGLATVRVKCSDIEGATEPRLLVAQLMGRLDERLDALDQVHATKTQQETQRLMTQAAAYPGEVKLREKLEADFASHVEALEKQIAKNSASFDAARAAEQEARELKEELDAWKKEQALLGPSSRMAAAEMGMPTPKLVRPEEVAAAEVEKAVDSAIASMPTPRFRVRPEVLARRAMSDDFTSDEKNVFMNAVRTDEAIGTEGRLFFPTYCLAVVCTHCGEDALVEAWDIGSARPVAPQGWGLKGEGRLGEGYRMAPVCPACVDALGVEVGLARGEAPDDEG